jgi:hypothetical protein
MEPEAQLQRRAAMDDAGAGADPDSTPSMCFEVARSVYNISVWKSYLPLDCVNAMIRMGWDCST